jgi:hypothetical protein
LRDLAPRRQPLLFRGKARFGETGAADDLIEARAIELPIQPLEGRIVGDLPRDLGVGDVQTHLPRALVERGFGDELPGKLLVEL